MALKKEEILEAVASLTVAELVELIKAMEEKFGVKAQAQVVAVAGGGTAGAPAAEEQTEFTVKISDPGPKSIDVIKVVRAVVAGIGLKDAKELVDNKGVVKENVSKDEAQKIKAELEKAGAKVEIS